MMKDILWQDKRDKPGHLTCKLCEDVIAPDDHEAHIASHVAAGWVDLLRSGPMKRLQTGYHTICHDCKAKSEESRENLDMHMALHGAPDSNTCANCGQIKPADSLSTYRVWYKADEA